MSPELRRLKALLRPYLMPVIKVFPKPVREYLVKLSVVELTERRLSAVDGFNGPFDRKIIQVVIKRLRHNSLDLSPLPSAFLEHLFSALRKDKGMSLAEISNISYEATSLDVNLLAERDWLGLYQMCCMIGLYQIGYIFREKTIEHTLSHAVVPKKHAQKYFSACLEKQKFSDEKFKSLVTKSELDEEDKQYFFILSDLLDPLVRGANDLLLDKEYKSYLREKSVAIVGPSESLNEDALEIDSYDDVARLNFTYTGKGCDENFNGNKATITYFNVEQVSNFHSKENTVLPSGIEYACLKSHEHIDKLADSNSEVLIRKLVSFDGFFYNGILNMGPIAALDMALHSSSPPKIYHMDLMLTVRRFEGYYPDSFDRGSDELLVAVFNRSTVSHDPVTQYRLFERLWTSGRILGDGRFDEVMTLGCEEYMKQLQFSYSGLD